LFPFISYLETDLAQPKQQLVEPNSYIKSTADFRLGQIESTTLYQLRTCAPDAHERGNLPM
jgi:hypothetical protein